MQSAWFVSQARAVRPALQHILDALLARPHAARHVHLNDLAEVIGDEAVTSDEVDELITHLEAAGLRVGEALDERDVGVMREVIAGGRRLAERLGRRPTVEEIAADTRHEPHVVRRALEHAAAAARRRG